MRKRTSTTSGSQPRINDVLAPSQTKRLRQSDGTEAINRNESLDAGGTIDHQSSINRVDNEVPLVNVSSDNIITSGEEESVGTETSLNRADDDEIEANKNQANEQVPVSDENEANDRPLTTLESPPTTKFLKDIKEKMDEVTRPFLREYKRATNDFLLSKIDALQQRMDKQREERDKQREEDLLRITALENDRKRMITGVQDVMIKPFSYSNPPADN